MKKTLKLIVQSAVFLPIAMMVFVLVFHAFGPGTEEVIYKKTTIMHLKGSTIEGTKDGPDGIVEIVKKPSTHKNLIRIRTNFGDKVLQSANDI